nr:UGT40R1 [Helicoverpa armigera]
MAAATYFLLFILLSSSCEASKILVVVTMPSRSHGNLGNGVVRELLKGGHEVTYIRIFEYKNAPPNLRQIDVSSNIDLMPKGIMNIQKIMDKDVAANDHITVKMMMLQLAVKTIEHQNVKKLLEDPSEHFDLVIVDWMLADVPAGLATVFGCPLVWLSPMEVNSLDISLIDGAPHLAYSTGAFSSNMPPFNFLQRAQELWTRIKTRYYELKHFDRMELDAYERLIVPYVEKRGRQAPSFYDVRYNASLILGNSHVSMGQALALPQNYKPIGGYHIDEDVKPLPEDLENIMMSAKNGVIYFSMGSHLKSKDWPEKVKRDLLNMFGQLKHTVLWKFEEDLPNLPKNVHILKWAPQASILSHPKCVLFITHGGLLSTTETIHYGVPIIGIPAFGDQFINVKRAINKGFALEVKLSYTVAADLKAAIEEILHNPKYRQKVKELSFIYHDRIAKPGAELLHWVHHVINTNGAPHLRSPALHIPLYQRLYLDLLGLISVVILLFFILLRVLCKLVCSKKQKETRVKAVGKKLAKLN